jgi:hypothetical protein
MSTSLAWKVVTSAFCSYSMPFECPQIAHRQDQTNASRTATVECAWTGGMLPNDDEIWLEIEYLGDASSPQGSLVDDGKANLLASAAAQTTSSATWGIAPTTFDGTPTGAVTVSNGNLTVTHGSTANGIGVQSTTMISAGKFYVEWTVQVSTSNTNAVGFKPFTVTYVDGGGTFTGGAGVAVGSVSTLIYVDAVNSGVSLGITAVGDVICAAIDLTAKLIWFRRNNGNWNNDGTANPATGVGGLSFPAGAQSPTVRFTNGASTDAFTANFGASAYAFTAPSGFGTFEGVTNGKFKLSAAFTPQQQSWIYGRVKCAKPSTTFYVDPKITLS